MKFPTHHRYRNREEKARYVWLKYESILTGRVLDVGADRGYLRPHLPQGVQYSTVGLEPDHDLCIDLEKPIPIESNSYNCVLCLDVLEHVEDIHRLFDDLCRITSKHLIISLPNPWADFLRTLKNGYYSENRPLKFYNLPLNPPKDRHRWFFNASEAKRFIEGRGRQNGMIVLQIDQMGLGVTKALYATILRLFVHRTIASADLFGGTVWAVLEKQLPSHDSVEA